MLAVCLLALPGKRADPAEEAEAMAALREARDGRRAGGSAGGSPGRAATADAGHRTAATPRPGLPAAAAGQ